MRWFVGYAQQSYGPYDDGQVIGLVQQGRADHVRGEAGGPWLPIIQSPFAAYLPRHPTPAVHAARTRPHKTGSPPIPPRKAAVVATVLFAITASHVSGAIGIVLGIGVVGWSIYSWRQKRRSLLSWAWPAPNSLPLTVLATVLGIVFLGLGSRSVAEQIGTTRERARLAAVASAKAEEATRVQAQLRDRAVKKMPETLASWRDRLLKAKGLSAQGDVLGARDATAQVILDISMLIQQTGMPILPELDTVQKEANAQLDELNRLVSAREKMAALVQQIADARSTIAQQEWIEADSKLVKANADADELSTLGHLVPKEFKLSAKKSEIARLRKSIDVPLAGAVKEQLYVTMCGEKPERSGWDNEIIGLESYIEKGAHDPSSIDVENCSNPELTAKDCWHFQCNVRGKNAFGAMVLQRLSFRYNKVTGFDQLN